MIQRPWPQIQQELGLQMAQSTFGAVIQPLSAEWVDGQLMVSGPPFALEWASYRFAAHLQQAAQAEVVFVPLKQR